ncbi:MAG: DUF1194 domain-containing protein [Pseudomonadota bacterium]
MRSIAFAFALGFAPLVQACDTALVLAVDVSNSIDFNEYDLQAGGIADALLDPEVRDALIAGKSALTVVQWSGAQDQVVSIPWRRITSQADADAFSSQARAMQRAIVNSNTAIGSAINFSAALFDQVGDCARHVIDISGDGHDNAQSFPQSASRDAERRGIEINGLVIERVGLAITNFYRLNVVTRNGFVMTARGHINYGDTLKEKMRRELSKAIAALD